MPKPRTTNGDKIKFPYLFHENSRTGRIKKWAEDKFGTYFMFAGQKKRNSFGTFEATLTYLEREFSRIDSNQPDSLALNPLNSDVRTYSELEQLLRAEGGGATLREAVAFFLANHKGKRFHPTSFDDTSATFLKAQRARNVSGVQIKTSPNISGVSPWSSGDGRFTKPRRWRSNPGLEAASMKPMVHRGA